MGEHLVVCVDHFIKPESSQGSEILRFSSDPSNLVIDIMEKDENLPLLQNMECRICQEEDSVKNLESPCACSGTLKFAHRRCVQRWCNEKGDTSCEICHQLYQAGYTAPPPHPEAATINIRGDPVDLHGVLAMDVAEQYLIHEAEYDDSSAIGAALCRSASLVLMPVLILRLALAIGLNNGDDNDMVTFFSLFLLRSAGFVLSVYILAWAITMMRVRRQREEEAQFILMLCLAAVSSGPAPETDTAITQGQGQAQAIISHLQPI